LHSLAFSGLQIIEKNYLEVYKYDKWNESSLPKFDLNECIEPEYCEMSEGKTTPPELLTEAALISIMDKNGIGTDATIAEHIKKVLDRKYAYKDRNYFVPSTLGLGLVKSYDQIGLEESLAKPSLRKQVELDLRRVCDGIAQKETIIREAINKYKEMFLLAFTSRSRIESIVGAHLEENQQENPGHDSNQQIPTDDINLSDGNEETSSDDTSRKVISYHQ
jgi:DNA topoisomerase-3